MGCRCNERREAIRQAASAGTINAAKDATRFVVRTLAEDIGRKLVRSGAQARRK
jgi:hypothetical protein